MKRSSVHDQTERAKCTIRIAVQYGDDVFIVKTVEVKGDDIVLFAPGKTIAHGALEFSAPVAPNYFIPYRSFADPVPQHPPIATHASVHGYKRVHFKSTDGKIAPKRIYTDINQASSVADFHFFIPRHPLAYRIKDRHRRNDFIIFDLPSEFNNDVHAIEFKLGGASKQIAPDREAEYKRMNPLSMRINCPSIYLYLSWRILYGEDAAKRGLCVNIGYEDVHR